jgi:hypothetical protein
VVGTGTGDAVIEGKEVTGFVPSDPGGVTVQPGITTNNTSTRETQTVMMDKGDLDIVLHPVSVVHYFPPENKLLRKTTSGLSLR